MHSAFRVVRLAGVAMLGMVAYPACVLAADMPVEYPTIEAPEPMAIPSVGGWYLRGDIGYKYYQAPKTELSNPLYGGGQYTTGGHDQLVNESLGAAADFGIGVGYKFNEYFRTDLTLDYETPARFKGSLWCDYNTTSCNSSPNGGYYDTERAKIAAYTALLNGYADLGTYNGFTPYVGAGVGASYLQTSSIRSSNYGSDGSSIEGDGNWNFAWALMAGVSYAVNQNLSVDLGYRYLNLGDAKTKGVTDSFGQTTGLKYNNIQAHEVRLGLRYQFN